MVVVHVMRSLFAGVWLLAFAGAQSCGNASSSAVPFPGLPTQYSMDVEVNIEGYNYTVFFEEVYDGNGASAVIEFFGTATSQTFVNFTSQTAFLVYADNSCVMGTLVTPTLLSDVIQQSFDPYYSGGNVRVASVLDLFKLANASAVYFGQDIVRGIPADRWQACITSLNTTYLFDFYYSSNGWVASFNKNQVPLLLVITRLGGQQNVTTHLFTFVDVNTGPGAVSASSFQVPLGLICKDRPPGKSLPPIPNNFNVLIETVSSTFQAVRVFQVDLGLGTRDFDHHTCIFLLPFPTHARTCAHPVLLQL